MSQAIDVQATGGYSVNAATNPPASTWASGIGDFFSGLSNVINGVGSAIITERQVEAQIQQTSAQNTGGVIPNAQTVKQAAASFFSSPAGIVLIGVAVAVIAKRYMKA